MASRAILLNFFEEQWTGVPNDNIVQNRLNMALLNVF